MSEKTRQELLYPKGRKSAAEKKQSIKHDPYQEFRDSPYVNPDPSAETYIEHLATCFKKCITSAALDVPGATKSQLGRLLWVEGERIPIYGTPKMFMAVTRSADMNKTPDVRTRVIIPEWACRVTVSFVEPILNYTTIANLFGVAGLTQGQGDWRPQKGSGNYGQFELVSEDDERFKRITKIGHAQQLAAMEDPQFHDHETERLYEWFSSEIQNRGAVKMISNAHLKDSVSQVSAGLN